MGGFTTTVSAAVQRHAQAHGVAAHLVVVVVPSHRAGQAVRRGLVQAGLRVLPKILTLDNPALLADALGVSLPAPAPALDGFTALWLVQENLVHLPPAGRLAQAASVWQLAERLGHYGHTLTDAVPYAPALAATAELLGPLHSPASLVQFQQLKHLAQALPGATVPLVMAGFRDDTHGVPPDVRAVLAAAAAHPLGLVVPVDADTPYTGAEHRVILTADQPMHEARLVALAVRQALAEGRSPTVVCASAPLTRAIGDALTLDGVAVDASAGQPLAHTAIGSWCALFLQVLADPTALALAALCAHPLTLPTADWPAQAHVLNVHGWRGLRVSAAAQTTWADWQQALPERLAAADAALEAFALLDGILAPLFGRALAVDAWLAALRHALNTLCPNWASQPFADMIVATLNRMADMPAPVARPTVFAAWLTHHLNETVVRAPRNPQAVPLLGPQEARLSDADHLILAGVNAGIWPSTPREEWLDTAAREALGLPPPGTQVLHALADFNHLWTTAAHVTASFSARDMAGQDMAPSPVLQALFQEAPTATVQAWTAAGHTLRNWLDAIHLPAPDTDVLPDCGAVFSNVPPRARWSASTMATLMQCPYRAALGNTLRLDDPAPYAATPSPADHGILLHRWLEAFTQNVQGLPGPWQGPLTAADTPQALALLQDIAAALLEHAPSYTRWVLAPRMAALAPALVDAWVRDGHGLGRAEKRLSAATGPVVFTAIADRLADTPDGLLIVDYKSGAAPNRKNVLTGRKPQLAVEAYIGSQHGPVADVQVWHLKGYGQDPLKVTGFHTEKNGLADIIAAAGDGMARYADAFGNGQAHPAIAGPWCATCALASICRTAALAGEETGETA